MSETFEESAARERARPDFAERQAERRALAATRDADAAAELRQRIAQSARAPERAALILRRRAGQQTAADVEARRAWYEATRWLNSGLAPEDYETLTDAELEKLVE